MNQTCALRIFKIWPGLSRPVTEATFLPSGTPICPLVEASFFMAEATFFDCFYLRRKSISYKWKPVFLGEEVGFLFIKETKLTSSVNWSFF